MKRSLILSVLACGASLVLGASVQAETPSPSPAASPSATSGAPAGHGHHRGGLVAHLTDALGLSGSQQAQVASIVEAAKPQLQQIRQTAETQRKQVFQTVDSQISGVLTADQQAKFAQLVQKFQGHAAGGGPRGAFVHHGGANAAVANGGGEAGQGDLLQRLTTQLGLSADQQGQIKPILAAAHTQIQSIRGNTSLTPGQKYDQIKTTMDAARGQINGILTPAQQQQLASLKGKFGRHHGAGASPSPSPAA